MLLESDKIYDQVCAALTAPGGQLEVTTAVIRGQELPVFKNAPPTLREYFTLGEAHGDLPFLVYQDERLSFGEVLKEARRYGAAFQAHFGIAKGDRVVLAMRNYPEWCLCFMGLITIGAVVVPLNAWWKADELAYAVSNSGARLIVADEERARRIVQSPAQAVPMTVVRMNPDAAAEAGWTPMERVLAGGPAEPFYLPPLDPEDDATILYTSGSTGAPKGAVSTHRAAITALAGLAVYGLAMNVMDEKEGKSFAHQTATLLTVPLFHVTGSHAVWLTCFLVGRKLVMMHRWDAAEALRLIEAERVTHFVGVPTMTLEMMEHPDRERRDISCLRDLGAGGAARPAEHVKQLAETFEGKRPASGYGLTETNALSVVANREGYLAKPASTGRPIRPITQLKIARDDAGTEAAPGEVGEIWWRTAALVRGYWMNPEATAAAFTADGWFKSGDLGYVDEDGYLFIVDRKKDIIIRGGENISCLEVEAALHSHPEVAEVSVFGLPDRRLGEVVGAVVFPKAGASPSEAALKEHAHARLAGFKVPARIWLTDEPLPRLGTGKIDKVSLRAHYRQMVEAEETTA